MKGWSGFTDIYFGHKTVNAGRKDGFAIYGIEHGAGHAGGCANRK
jgi:hypothetical protein